MRLRSAYIPGLLLVSMLISNSAVAASKAVQYLANQEITEACDGADGKFEAGGLIERDLDGDGRADLVLSHEGISCRRNFSRSGFCGAQVCTVKIYLRRGNLLKLVDEFLGAGVKVGGGKRPKITAFGHGGGKTVVRRNGSSFADAK
ncbi:MAG: hypothetical protein AAF468_15710 [Pseudomonadota bacterium]